ncbi:MAG: aminotransferase class III-fold pyridoxal phosphate-dependent enzyme [Planctomycetota bacterium]|nr:aminotransferase class III-fold pyridoxal phosphate-dependent enzyme [Planctomycetota bacterium]
MAASGYPASEEIARASARHIAGGVVSLNRKTDPPIAFVRAQGSRLYDAEGRAYIDYHAAFAPHILGHNDPGVNAAVKAAMDEGLSLMGSGPTPWEARLAELLRACVPSLDLVQITNTGSEATAHAIRLSRAYTGREDIVLMLGGYNGWHNDVARAVMPDLEATGPRVSPGEYPFLPSSAGIPEGVGRRVHLVNFNDLASVEYVLRRHPVACVLTEPALQNIGVVPPKPGYLEGLKKLCAAHGALLVFDEVKTGFRAALGGYQSRCGVAPDLSVFGKAVANGYPLGVIGGRRDVMERFADPDPKKRVLIAGTYNAHPFTAAAAIATIERLRANDGEVYAALEAKGARLQRGLEELFAEKGLPAAVSRIGSAFCVYFMDRVPADWHELAAHHDFEQDRRLRRALLARGVYHFPLAAKQGSLSAAHSDEDLARTLEATREALKDLRPSA